MSEIRELAILIKELEDQMVVCMRCGMCQAVCPLFQQTGREADVARGKLALLDGLMQEVFQQPESVRNRLEKCLLCGSCAANCPSGVKVLEIFIKARAIITGIMGLSPAKRLALRGMLARPGLFDRLAEWGSRLQNLFVRPANEIVGTSCARLAPPFLDQRHFRPLARTPLHQQLPELDTQGGTSGFRVAFFTGCLLDKIFPQTAMAALEVLQAHGVDVFMPRDQACCGIPALSAGDMKTFSRLVRHNLRRFAGRQVDAVVTACATCSATLHEIWPTMVSGEDKATARQATSLARKTMDISDFLVTRLGIGQQSDSAPPDTATAVTYHDPCHLKKSLGVAAQPRALIRAAGRPLVEMAQPDACCGMGGSFNLQYYEISRNIGRIKKDRILETGCHTVATGCPACMMQISDLLSQAGAKIAVRHAIEIYAESIRGDGADSQADKAETSFRPSPGTDP